MPVSSTQGKRIRQMLKDCRACPEEDKAKYMQEFYNERKRGAGKIAERVQQKQMNSEGERNSVQSSMLFQTVFANKYRGQVCADNGADGNIMDTRTLSAIQSTGADISVQQLHRPHVFEMAAATSNG